MIIVPGSGDILAHVNLADGEYLPTKFNDPRVVVYRQGDSTDRKMVVIKPLGVLAPELLRPAPLEAWTCQHAGPDPLHQHPDQTWWFSDAEFKLEKGPFADYDTAFKELEVYCIDYQKTKEFLLTIESEADKIRKVAETATEETNENKN